MLRVPVLGLVCILIAISGGVSALETNLGKGAVLRGLDKASGKVVDIEIGNGGLAEMGRLRIRLKECRYPTGNASGEAYAFLTILETDKPAAIFTGWMIASSPAINPLDHARYDVWVLRCKTK